MERICSDELGENTILVRQADATILDLDMEIG